MDDESQNTLLYLSLCEKFDVEPHLLVTELLTMPSPAKSSPMSLRLPNMSDGDVEALCGVIPKLTASNVNLDELAFLSGDFGIRGGALCIASLSRLDPFLFPFIFY